MQRKIKCRWKRQSTSTSCVHIVILSSDCIVIGAGWLQGSIMPPSSKHMHQSMTNSRNKTSHTATLQTFFFSILTATNSSEKSLINMITDNYHVFKVDLMVSIFIQKPSGVSHRRNPLLTAVQGSFQTFSVQIWLHISAAFSPFPLPSLKNEAKKHCITLEKAMQGRGGTKTSSLQYLQYKWVHP